MNQPSRKKIQTLLATPLLVASSALGLAALGFAVGKFSSQTTAALFKPADRTEGQLHSASLSEEEEIAKEIASLFQSTVRVPPIPGSKLVRRPVFAKDQSCVKATFSVNENLPESFRVGIFKSSSPYNAIVRFANDGPFGSDQSKGARGMSIKLSGVSGDKILEGETLAKTQDFVMQNYPIFFTKTAADFLAFTQSGLSGDPIQQKQFAAAHPETKRILDLIDAEVLSDPLDGTYWTPTPYRFGDRAMKYMVKPCAPPPPTNSKPRVGEHYLRENLMTHNALEDSCFDFMIQLQKDEASMPLDDATVLWSLDESPFIPVAKIQIAKNQDLKSTARQEACEYLSFTGWHALPEHEPLGSINRARKIVYKTLAEFRRLHNPKMPKSEDSAVELFNAQ